MPVQDSRTTINRLLAAAEQDGQDAAVLAELLWLINVHYELTGLVQVCRHLLEIISLLAEIPGTSAEQVEIDSWVPALKWTLKDPKQLAQTIFESETVEAERQRERFLRLTVPNPYIGTGAKRYGLCSTLWASHPDWGLQESFRIVQAHLLLAHIAVMRYNVSFVDWSAKKEPHPGFYESLYRPALFVRRFTQTEGGWHSVLAVIPLDSSQKDYPDRLRDIANTIDPTAMPASIEPKNPSASPQNASPANALRCLANFSEWGLDPAAHTRKTRSGAKGNPRGGGPHIGGVGDVGESKDAIDPFAGRLEDVEISFGDLDDRDGRAIVLHLPIRWHRDVKRYTELLDAGDHPGEELSSRPIQLSEEVAGVAIAAGGGMEMANQLLPFAYKNLSSVEMARLLYELQKAADAEHPELLELYALTSAILWTGASLDQALGLLMFADQAPHTDCDLALILGDSLKEELNVAARWRVRALTLTLKPKTLPPAELSRELTDHIYLPDTIGGSAAVQDYVRFMRTVVETPSAQLEAMKQRPLRVFMREPAWYKKQFELFLDEHDPSGRISFTKISRMIFQRIVEESNVVSAALITGTDHLLASVKRHYYTPEVRNLQRTYVVAATGLNSEFASAGFGQERSAPFDLARAGVCVGSPLCPIKQVVQDAVRWFKTQIAQELPAETTQEFRPALVRLHNLYTLYCVWSFSFAVGIRGVGTPYLHSSLVDRQLGLATISDKDDGSGYKSRLTWLPEAIREQMRLYEAHLSSIASKFGLPLASRKLPCYFLSENMEIQIVRPGTVSPLLHHCFPFPANVARHFVSTELQENGFSSEEMDAWMGHWWQGEEPWGMYSSFSFSQYLRHLERILPPLLSELGFEPIEMRYSA